MNADTPINNYLKSINLLLSNWSKYNNQKLLPSQRNQPSMTNPEKEVTQLDQQLSQYNFWLLPPDPIRATRKLLDLEMKNPTKTVSADAFYLPPCFIWMPASTFSITIRCWGEDCDRHVMTAKGRPEWPRKAYGLKENCYIFTQRLHCAKCRQHPLATHPQVMSQYPDWVS